VTCFDAFESLCAYLVGSIMTVFRIILDPSALRRFRSHTLNGFVPLLFPSCVCGLLCFAIPHSFYLRAIREVDLSVIVALLPLNFVLCGIVDFREFNTAFLALISVGIAAMMHSLTLADYALPDLDNLFDLLIAQFSWSLGLVIHKKTLQSCDTCLTLLFEMAIGLIVTVSRLYFQMSWASLIEMAFMLSNDFLSRAMWLSLVIKPCLCFCLWFTLNFSDLRVSGVAFLIPLFLESERTVVAFSGLAFVLLGVLLSPPWKKSNDYEQLAKPS
jgi:hypothetical protein